MKDSFYASGEAEPTMASDRPSVTSHVPANPVPETLNTANP